MGRYLIPPGGREGGVGEGGGGCPRWSTRRERAAAAGGKRADRLPAEQRAEAGNEMRNNAQRLRAVGYFSYSQTNIQCLITVVPRRYARVHRQVNVLLYDFSNRVCLGRVYTKIAFIS